jgi:hypothetical protein
MIEPSQELWVFVNMTFVVLVAGRSDPNCSCSGTDQIEVGDPTRFPSFFQSSHQLPELSRNKSGSILPPSDPMMVGDPQAKLSWQTTGLDEG